jgi:hypothetical protein
MKIALLALCICLMNPGAAFARQRVTLPPTRSLTLDCVVEAARANDVPLAALLGILAVEGGKVGEALRNSNGTFDLGPFQLNTCNLTLLETQGFAPESILRDGCVNAHAAAKILRLEVERAGNIWGAVGAYHSRTPAKRDGYIRKVRTQLVRMSGKGLALPEGSGQ